MCPQREVSFLLLSFQSEVYSALLRVACY
uniref:Uncharacterized protein n=1 Tax=Heterorhabditis bacteriophora TaxID=37862 RepID=A0A1I7WW24_HETBA